MLLKQLRKCASLRIVNFIGLATVMAGLALSFSYIKKEMSYDRYHQNADRIARLSFRYENEELDGRIVGLPRNSPVFEECGSLEEVALMRLINTALMVCGEKSKVINNMMRVTPGFFRIFDLKWREGGEDAAADRDGRVALSASLARELFGEEPALGRELKMSSRQFEEQTFFVSGVYDDMPSASHFHTDLIAYRADNDAEGYSYAYVLLRPGVSMEDASAELSAAAGRFFAEAPRKPQPELMPLTDIHLHSRALRELEPNGNISYIYIMGGANALLLLIVMFNLWLNAGLIFARNRKFYRLLRLNGASTQDVIGLEARLAALLAAGSVVAGACLAIVSAASLGIDIGIISAMEWGIMCAGMFGAIVGVSLWPIPGAMASTLFLNNNDANEGFSLAKVKYMLIAQYAMVMFIVILSFGISRQIQTIRRLQVGGNTPGLLVMKEQAAIIQEKYDLLRAELLRHPEIEAVTAAMQLPGSAIRDALNFKRPEQADAEAIMLPIMVVGDDFMPFFRIDPVAG
ncbi:MAG: ABC transporter permease, partial [Tannerellaceae bacterium]|nr:ABC transporter permease [Tannerellaceae bacterium]